jgi:hypothetical protein
MLNGDSIATKAWASLTDKHESGIICSARYAQGQMGSQSEIADVMAQASSHVLQRRDACSGSDLQSAAPSALAVARKRQVHSQVCDLTRVLFYSYCTLKLSNYFIMSFSEQQLPGCDAEVKIWLSMHYLMLTFCVIRPSVLSDGTKIYSLRFKFLKLLYGCYILFASYCNYMLLE